MSSAYPTSPLDPQRGTCVVTGGAGFVGAAAVRALLQRGRNVVVLDNLSSGRLERLPLAHEQLRFERFDVCDAQALAEHLGALDVTQVLHLAGPVGVRRVLADPELAAGQIGDLGKAMITALASLPAGSRPRLFAASTSEVYDASDVAMGEDAPLRTPGGAARWSYALAKQTCEEHYDAAHLWEVDAGPVHLRLFNVVGPGQDADGGMVLPTFLQRALAGASLPVHGDGRQVRTYGHVLDVAEDIADMLGREFFPAGPLNLGGTATASATELAQLVSEEVCALRGGKAALLEYVDPAATLTGFAEVRRRIPDLARAHDLGLARRNRTLQAIVIDSLEAALRDRTLPCASPGS
ncbi:MAG: UDP-glucose 4-epimerase [Planctomycetota bacterium]|jgi:UDP-glucose 4-epimerase